MSSELRDIHSRVERLRNILHRAIRALAVLDGMAEFAEASSKWDDAAHPPREHKMLLTAYDGFFDPVRAALLLDAHIQLGKLLIENDGSLHLKKLVRHVRSQDSKIQKSQRSSDFAESIEDFAVWYDRLTPADLDHIATQFEVNEWLISKLELVRNKKLGHENLREVPAQMLTRDELHTLADLSEGILKRLASLMGLHDAQRHKLNDVKSTTISMLNCLYRTY